MVRYIAYICLFVGPVAQLVLRELTEAEPFSAMSLTDGSWPRGRVSAVILLWSVGMVCMDVGGMDSRLDSFDSFAVGAHCCDTAQSLRMWMYVCQVVYVGLVWLGFAWLVGRSHGTREGGSSGMPAFFHGYELCNI